VRLFWAHGEPVHFGGRVAFEDVKSGNAVDMSLVEGFDVALTGECFDYSRKPASVDSEPVRVPDGRGHLVVDVKLKTRQPELSR
jgi:hypothetical protein